MVPASTLEPPSRHPRFTAREGLNGFLDARSSEEGSMSRVSMFNSPLLLGFDQLERTLDRLAKSAEGYPPYNIERIGENGLRITLAVAGFTIDDLVVELVENQLTVRGKQTDDTDRVFLHRGIAARQFQRAFMLADGIEGAGARLDNGLLSIDSSPLSSRAPATSMPSASMKARWNCRAAMPRCRKTRSVSSVCLPRTVSWFSTSSTTRSSIVNPATASVMRRPFSPIRSIL